LPLGGIEDASAHFFAATHYFFFFLSQLHGTFKEKGEEHRQLNLSKN
jgi:hypothetical protein